MKHELESRFGGEITASRYADDTTLMANSEEELKSLLRRMKEESEKATTLQCSAFFMVQL